ncbi:DNA-binding protein [Acidiferrobacter sp.]|uniref:DNA-binding protein n=1 Tax=Acidiferrobacter sp. TaxID=1872107 RepID=UPI00262A47F1|nr:DNA-binding protein [Acidiferrobacter sp.]
MPRTGITREQVFAVADRLADQGIAPTVAIVRSDLGKGSFTTINQHLGEWKALKWKAEGLTASLPPAVETKARESLATLWEFAAREAGQTVERIREAALRDVSEMQEALEDAQRQCAALGTERQELHKHLGKAHQTIATLTTEIARLSESLAASAARLEDLERRLDTVLPDHPGPRSA